MSKNTITVRVRSVSPKGFYRYGRKFTPEWQDVELTQEQFDRIQEKDQAHLVAGLIEESDDTKGKAPEPRYPDGDPSADWKAKELKAYLEDKHSYDISALASNTPAAKVFEIITELEKETAGSNATQ